MATGNAPNSHPCFTLFDNVRALIDIRADLGPAQGTLDKAFCLLDGLLLEVSDDQSGEPLREVRRELARIIRHLDSKFSLGGLSTEETGFLEDFKKQVQDHLNPIEVVVGPLPSLSEPSRGLFGPLE